MSKCFKLLSLMIVVLSICGFNIKAAELDIVDISDHTYTYQEMQEDIVALKLQYPECLSFSSVGKSVDNRDIWQIVIGNPEADKAIYVQAGLHGREWLNSWVLMQQIEETCKSWNTVDSIGIEQGSLFEQCAVYVIPMVNPDGITISQYGIEGITDYNLRVKLYQMPGASVPSRWKANANGVDLNRQFFTGWNSKINIDKPASENYNGVAPFTEPEALAIKDVLDSRKFDIAVSYHSMEGAIYWDLKQQGLLRDKTYNLAKYVGEFTGYKLGEESPLKGLEYNYMIYEKGIPTIVVETGTVQCPLPYSQFNKVVKENSGLFIKLLEFNLMQ